jgi:F5/8 type C domain
MSTSGPLTAPPHRRLPALVALVARHGRYVLLAVAIGVTTVTVPALIARAPQRHGAAPPATAPSAAAPSATAPSATAPPATAPPAGPVPSTATRKPAETLLSQGRPASASSTESDGTPPAAAVDGSGGTRWSSAFSDPQWLKVDLGATATITRVVLRWDSAYARAYRIQTSGDGNTWTTVYGTSTSTGGTQSLTVSGKGQYVRMLGTARATQWGYSLSEFEVYGIAEAGSCGAGSDVALHRPVTASSAQDGAYYPPSNAVDGNPDTRWSSQAGDPQWIEVDLGSSQHLCQVVLAWEAAYATAYQIQTSPDGVAWTSIYGTTTATGGTETVAVTGTGRYLRVYGTARATGYGYSLWELTVYARTAGGA